MLPWGLHNTCIRIKFMEDCKISCWILFTRIYGYCFASSNLSYTTAFYWLNFYFRRKRIRQDKVKWFMRLAEGKNNKKFNIFSFFFHPVVRRGRCLNKHRPNKKKKKIFIFSFYLYSKSISFTGDWYFSLFYFKKKSIKELEKLH